MSQQEKQGGLSKGRKISLKIGEEADVRIWGPGGGKWDGERDEVEGRVEEEKHAEYM